MAKSLATTFSLGSISFDPCSRNGDGAIRRPSRASLGMQTSGGRPADLGAFAAKTAGEVLLVTIRPLTDDGQEELAAWSGYARLAGCRFAPPLGEDTNPRVHARLVVHAETPANGGGVESVDSITDLVVLRAAMAATGVVAATVELRQHQPGLGFDEGREAAAEPAPEEPAEPTARRRGGRAKGPRGVA